MRMLATTFLLCLLPSLSFAGDVLLTFQHQDDIVELQMTDLQEMGETEITTTTIWTEGKQSFVGVSLHDFLEEYGISDGELVATAINDYEIVIPVEDAVEGGPIIAYLHNGEPMSVRNKGPLWIVYPYDSDVRFQTEVVYSRSIWQLDRLKTME